MLWWIPHSKILFGWNCETTMFYIRVIVKIEENKLKTICSCNLHKSRLLLPCVKETLLNWFTGSWIQERQSYYPMNATDPWDLNSHDFCSSSNERQHRVYKDRYILNMATLLLHNMQWYRGKKINTVKLQQKTEVYNITPSFD